MHFDPCSAISANSERLKNLSTTGFYARRGLVLALRKFDVFVLVMRIIPNLLYPPIKAVVDRYCIRITPFAVHDEKIRIHLCELTTNSAKLHS